MKLIAPSHALRLALGLFIIFGSAVSPKTIHTLEITENAFVLNSFIFAAVVALMLIWDQHRNIFINTNLSLYCIFPIFYFLSFAVNTFIAQTDFYSLKTTLRYGLTMLVALIVTNLVHFRFLSLRDCVRCLWIVLLFNVSLMLLYILHASGYVYIGWMDHLYKGITAVYYMSFGPFSFEMVKASGFFTETTDFALFAFMLFVVRDSLDQAGIMEKPGRLSQWFLQGLVLFLFSKGVLTGYVTYLYLSISARMKPLARFVIRLLLLAPLAYFVYQFFSIEWQEILAVGARNKISGSIGDRLFLARYTCEYFAENPARSLFGFGPRMMGIYLQAQMPDIMRDINPMSIFSILADTGLVGFAAYLLTNVVVWLNLRTSVIKRAFIGIFIANLGMSLYISFNYFIVLFLLLYVDDRLAISPPVNAPPEGRLADA